MELNEETKGAAIIMLKLIENKHEVILKKEQEILQIKAKLEHMINKINRLLKCGNFFDNKVEVIKDLNKKIENFQANY